MSARKSANQQDITMEKLLKSQNSPWLKHRRNLCFLFLWMAAQICFEASLTEMVLRGCLRVLGVIMEYDLFRWWLNMGLLISYAYHTWLCKGQTLEGPPKAGQMSAVSVQVWPWRWDEEELNWEIQEWNSLSVCHWRSHTTTLCLSFIPYEAFAPTSIFISV